MDTLRNNIIEEIKENWRQQHFDEEQRDYFVDLLLELTPRYCLETGFCTGTSSATILATCKPKKMISIGLSSNDLKVAANLEEKYNFSLVKGDSTMILNKNFFEKEFSEGIDFYHVDGGHAYSVAVRDLKNAYPYMNERATIIVDDYRCRAAEQGHPELRNVTRAVDDFVRDYSLEDNTTPISTNSGKGMALIKL